MPLGLELWREVPWLGKCLGSVTNQQKGKLVEDRETSEGGNCALSGCPQAESGCASCKHSTTSPIPPFPFQLVSDRPSPPASSTQLGQGHFAGGDVHPCGDAQFRMRMLQHLLVRAIKPWQDCGEKGKAKSPELVVGRSHGGNAAALLVVAVAVGGTGGHLPPHRKA